MSEEILSTEEIDALLKKANKDNPGNPDENKLTLEKITEQQSTIIANQEEIKAMLAKVLELLIQE